MEGATLEKKESGRKRRAFFLLLSAALIFSCSSGSSDEQERVYGTPVDSSTFFKPDAEPTKSKEVQLAQCITGNGAVIYGSRGCSITRKQLARFGNGAKYLDYVDCNDHRDQCSKNRIDYYPTWICKGERLEGNYHLDFLARFAGCD